MGGDGAVLIEIIIFAMIAVFLVYRLRSVLGRRTGEERQRPNPFNPPEVLTDRLSGRDRSGREERGGRDNVIPLPGRNTAPTGETAEEPLSLAAHLAQIEEADPEFDEKIFLGGARQAFTMIVTAFAAGDTATLRPLLADDVYDNFTRAIRARTAAGETLDTHIAAIRDADVVDARLDGRSNAVITVRFVSDQSNVTRDRNGEVVDGTPNQLVEVIDEWTFTRNLRSRDPNWMLVETRTAG